MRNSSINDIKFKGKRQINWNDVKNYLEQYVGEFYEIADTKDIIYIGKDLPDEYTGSKYTHKLKGGNANAAQGILELLEIAEGKHFKENNAEKHKRNAKNGWYRYDILDIKKKRATLSNPKILLAPPFL